MPCTIIATMAMNTTITIMGTSWPGRQLPMP